MADGSRSLWDRLIHDPDSGDAAWDGYIDAPRPRPTRLSVLDSLLGGGVYPGVNVLMAAPGAGKTALAIQLLATNALSGGTSLMFSLEMPPTQVKMRVASWMSVSDPRLSPVPWSGTYLLADRSWAQVDWARAERSVPAQVAYVEELCGRPSEMPLEDVVSRMRSRRNGTEDVDSVGLMAVEAIMRASGDQTIAAIDEASRLVLDERMAVTQRYRDVRSICAAMRQLGDELGGMPLVAVDYLQIVTPSEDAAGLGETEATKAISDELAMCARDTGAIVLCVSAKRKGSGPEMDAARGSSAITYNAQTVIHLDDDAGRQPVRGWKPVVLDVSKNRSGGQGRVPLWFNGRYNAFSDLEEPPGEPAATGR